MTTTEPLDPPADVRFSEVIREATFSDHEHAAMSGFMTSLFQRQLPLDAYTSMVAQHWFAYVELERAGDALAAHPVAGAFVHEELRRVPTLEADLQHLLGDGWREQITPGDATTRYCERIAEVCADRPEAFVAHHYTRYMGDLSGGQMIGRIAREVYELQPGAGAAFYEFPGIEDLKAFKDAYRRQLDEAAWSDEERERLLAEVVVAYRLNTEVFEDLDRELQGGSAR
jgi:heme oxygenase